MSAPQLYENTRWPAFIERYAADLCAFAEEVCGVELDAEERRAYLRASKPGACMVLSDIHNKSSARLEAVALWAMLFHPRNEVVVIASRSEVHKRHWALYKRVLLGPHQWLGEHLHITRGGVRTDAGYAGPRIVFRIATNNAPENLAGMYGNRMFFLVEGAAGISDNCMQVLRAAINAPAISEVLALSCFTIVQTQQ